MADNNSFIRLGKAAKEFNVGIQTLVEHLAKKGSRVDSSPNTKISESDYAILAKEFAADKVVKSKIQSVESSVSGGTKSKEVETKDEPAEDEKVLIIKSTQLEVEPTKIVKPKVLGKIDLGSLDQPPKRKEKSDVAVVKEEPNEVVIVEAEVEKKAVEQPVEIVSEKKVEAVSKEAVSKEAVSKETVSKDDSAHPTIVDDKIVEDNNPKEVKEVPKPVSVKEEKKVSVDDKKHDKVAHVDSQDHKKEHPKDVKKEHKKVENNNGYVEKPKNDAKFVDSKMDKKKPEIAKDKKVDVAARDESKAVVPHVVDNDVATSEVKPENNFIETKYVKLDGPNVLRTIDLSQFNKPVKKPQPVASSSDDLQKQKKNKRKRIKNDTPSVNKTGNAGDKPANAQTGNKHQHGQQTKPGGQDVGHKDGNKGQKPNTPQQGGHNAGKKYGADNAAKRGHVGNKKAPLVRVEPTEEEVKKQIQETLARLSPTGKSKYSKHKRDKRELRKESMADAFEQGERDKMILKVSEFVTVNELATMMDVPVTQVISTCMNLGMFVSINMRLDAEALVIVADEFGFKLDFVGADIDEELTAINAGDTLEDTVPRPPIVTVMGHVDHGKTKLLDYIRSANVVAGEAGGITQHIGAYEVTLSNGKRIAFLDTPGHEAFTAMRARGAEVTDVAIIVIAADDSVMPQTREAINHAQAANVPIVFAFNKVDKPTADVERIKNALAQMNILVEDWGGKYQCQEISAKTGLNVSNLLDKVLLEAELLDLRANPNRNASGTIIESSLDKGRGYVAKIMVQNGTLRVGDVVIAGCVYGKVKAMYNERNQVIKEAGPSTPLLLLGLSGAPQAGDKFVVMSDEKEAKNIVTRRQQLQREQGLRTQKHITLDEIGRRIAIGDFKELNIIVKGDVDGSVEALSDSLLKLSTNEVQVNVIHRSVGQVTESDILLASASNAIVVAFQVRPSAAARKLAESEQIDVRTYSIIYNAIEEIKSAIEGMLSPEIEEKILCNVEVRETFKIPKTGTVAGCMVLDGVITRNTKVRVIRDGIVVYNGSLGSLKRFKDDVKEVKTGYECGLNIENYNDIKIGDIIEGYDFIEIKRTLS